MKYVAVTACAILSALLLGCDVEVKVGAGDEGGSFEIRTSETESPLDDRGEKK